MATSPLGNGSHGVTISNTATNNIIGGSATGEGNVIAYSTGDGVWIDGSTTDFNLISGNAIFENGGLGIDLDSDGVGTGGGANNNKAAPVITGITPSGSDFTIVATAGSGDTVEFFRVNNAAAPAATADPSGSGEGYSTWEAAWTTAPAAAPTSAPWPMPIPAAGSIRAVLLSSGVSVGDAVSATATDSSNNTSEFSVNALAQGAADLVLTKMDNPDPAPAGGPLVYTLFVSNNGPTTANNVTLIDTLPAGVTFQSATPSQGNCSGTTTVTCNLGAIFNGGTASVEILVVTSGAGTITNTASVTADETDPVPGNNNVSEDTDVVVSPMFDVPLTQYTRLHGFIDYTTTGGSLRTQPNSQKPLLGDRKFHGRPVRNPGRRHRAGSLSLLGRLRFNGRQSNHPRRLAADGRPHLHEPFRPESQQLRLLRRFQGRHRRGAGQTQRELHLQRTDRRHNRPILLFPGGYRRLVADRDL